MGSLTIASPILPSRPLTYTARSSPVISSIASEASQIEVILFGFGLTSTPSRGSSGMKVSAFGDETRPAELPGSFGVGSNIDTGVSPTISGTVDGRTNVQSSRHRL